MIKATKLPLAPWIVAREKVTRGYSERIPEPMVMDEPEGARDYDAAGEEAQVPFHDFNARAMSRLLPENGTVVDLGCGSGRLLARLAKGRPDVRIIGLDLSDPMLELGRELLTREGLSDRVELRKGDITTFDADVRESFDLVSCNYAIHQLPDETLVMNCLEAIARARNKTGCAVYIYDLARLHNPRTWPDLLSMFAIPDVFRKDAIASERAAFTLAELTERLSKAGLGDLEHHLARPLGENQAHLAERRGEPAAPVKFRDVPYPRGTRWLTALTTSGFPQRLTRNSAE